MKWIDIKKSISRLATNLQATGFRLASPLVLVREGDVWQCIAATSSRDKARIAIELGVQPSFLVEGELDVAECEFRETTCGWEPVADVDFDMLSREVLRGVEILDGLRRFEALLEGLSLQDIAAGKTPSRFIGTEVRLAWVAAKYYWHLGGHGTSREFARVALDSVKGEFDEDMRADLERILEGGNEK